MRPTLKKQCYAAFKKYDGLPVTEIARKTGITPTTLHKWRKEWLAEKTTPVGKKVMEIVELERDSEPFEVDVSKHCGSVVWAVVVGFILGVVFMFVVSQL